MTIQDVLNDRSNNFTLMRLLAAIAVLYFHCYPLAGGPNMADSYSPFMRALTLQIGQSSVDMFFVISGFLITASYLQRTNILTFLEARILRIFPALIVANLFCMLIIGAAVTTESLSTYLTSPATWSFFKLNIFLIDGIQLGLPGVFSTNPLPLHVNGSLWTLSIEVGLYFWVALLGSCAILQSPAAFNVFFLSLSLMYAQATQTSFFIVHIDYQVRVAFYFLLGSFLYINRSTIPLSFSWLICVGLFTYFAQERSIYPYLTSIAFAYGVILCGLHPLLRLRSLDTWGDISYGVYIYAFPIQQLTAYLIPGISPMGMLAVALPITCLVGIMSWRLVESPALGLKGKLSATFTTR